VIDFHAHFLTRHYVEQASAAGHVTPDGMPSWPQWDPDRHLRLMASLGIRLSVLSISSPGVHFGDDAAAAALARHVNDAAAELTGRHPERLRFLASLPLPDVAGAVAELERTDGVEGRLGVVLLSHAGGGHLGDPRFSRLWEELDRRAAIVLVHPTSPPGWEVVADGRPRPLLEFFFETARTAVDLLESDTVHRYPRTRIILPHAAGALPVLVDRLKLFALRDAPNGRGPGIADQLRDLWFDVAGTPFPTQVPALLQHVALGRLVYGSDSCFTPAPALALHLGSIDAQPPVAGLGWRDLLTANGNRLLHAEDPAPSRTSASTSRSLDLRQRLVAGVFRRAAERLLLGPAPGAPPTRPARNT
jgi:predicted TIM-barrel fold metal-dependent hydrolase